MDQPQVRDATNTIVSLSWDTEQPVQTPYDLSIAANANVVPLVVNGVGADLELTWNTFASAGGVFSAYLEDVTLLNGGNGYIVGDSFTVDIDNEIIGVDLDLTVDEVQLVESGYKASNIVTVGGIVNSTIRNGDSVRLINAGKQYLCNCG